MSNLSPAPVAPLFACEGLRSFTRRHFAWSRRLALTLALMMLVPSLLPVAAAAQIAVPKPVRPAKVRAFTSLSDRLANTPFVSPAISALSPVLPTAPPSVASRHPASLPLSLTLLDEVGHLARPVADLAPASWKLALTSHLPADRAARLHLWLGEWELAEQQQPEAAQWHFRQAQHLTKPTQALYGLAAYDRAVALYYAGAYRAAADSFGHLLTPKAALRGYERRTCALWHRHALACAGYHEERSQQGIPEPPRLDPLCAVAALASSLRALGRPFDKKTLLASCRVTGEGSNLHDVADAARPLHVSIHTLTADDAALKTLPKPLVAYVEHDHFISVIRADKKGVSYLCSDCGPWPGGQVDLTWKQWHLLNPGIYAAVTLPGSAWDKTLAEALRPGTAGGARVASADLSQLSAPRLLALLPQAARLSGHVFRFVPPNRGVTCGTKLDAQHCAECLICCLMDSLGGGGGLQAEAQGASAGDPVNLATGEEEYSPGADLTVYNPHGPSVHWSHSYNSLRALPVDNTFEEADFGVGWTQPYSVGVLVPGSNSGGGGGGGGVGSAVAVAAHSRASATANHKTNATKANTTKANTTKANTITRRSAAVSNPSPYPYGSTKYLVFANGARISFSGPDIWYTTPSPRNYYPPIQMSCQVANGTPLQINAIMRWDYVINAYAVSQYKITFPDRTTWITGASSGGAYSLFNPIGAIVDSTNHALVFQYDNYQKLSSIIAAPFYGTTIDASHRTTLLSVNRTNDVNDTITSVSDCYGRSVYYHVGSYANTSVPPNYPQAMLELDRVSQIVPTGTASPPDRYAYGYQNINNLDGQETVPFLHTITVPSPAGPAPLSASLSPGQAGTSTATINYDPATDYVSSLVDANGNSRSYSLVDGTHTQVTVKDAQGNIAYSYTGGFDSNMSGQSTTDGNGTTLATATFSDPNDPYQPSSVTDANNHTWNYTWDSFGNQTSETTPRGTKTTYTWNHSSSFPSIPTDFTLGELRKVQAGTKTPTTYIYYEPSGLPYQVTSAQPGTSGSGATVTTTYTYDSVGNVLTEVTPAPSSTSNATLTTTYTYATDTSGYPLKGQPITITNNIGKVTHLSYDARGNQLTRTDQVGNEVDYTHNIADQMLTMTMPATGQTGTGHASEVSGYLYPNGPHTYESRLDESGNQVRQTTTTFGPEGETLAVAGSTEPTSYTYDALYRMKTLTDGNGNAAHYYYTAAGYLGGMTYPGYAGPAWPNLSGPDSITFPGYNGLGEVTQRVDGRGITTTYAYNDIESRLTDVIYSDGTPSLHLGNPDAYGRFRTMTDGSGTTTYAFDDLDEITQKTVSFTGLSSSYALSYGYYPDGSRSRLTTPAGTISYTYDDNGRQVNMGNAYGEIYSWSYFDNDWLNASRSPGVYTANHQYPDGSLSQLFSIKTAGAAWLNDFSNIRHDGAGNILSYAADSYGNSPYAGQSQFQYDSKDQLTQAQSAQGGGYSQTFGYDPAGNPTALRGQSIGAVNADNQLPGTSYDGEGNPTSRGGATLSWDAEQRLTSYGLSMTAGYNGNSLRAWKQGASGKTYFLYDGDSPVCELDQNGNVAAVNTWGGTSLMSRHAGGSSTFYAFDPSGNPSRRTDSSGNVIGSYLFDAYGNRQSTDNSTDPYSGFQSEVGGYTDAETGLVLLGHRYYDPQQERFLNRDPMSYDGGINVYAYTANNPSNSEDADGFGGGSVTMPPPSMPPMTSPPGPSGWCKLMNVLNKCPPTVLKFSLGLGLFLACEKPAGGPGDTPTPLPNCDDYKFPWGATPEEALENTGVDINNFHIPPKPKQVLSGDGGQEYKVYRKHRKRVGNRGKNTDDAPDFYGTIVCHKCVEQHRIIAERCLFTDK